MCIDTTVMVYVYVCIYMCFIVTYTHGGSLYIHGNDNNDKWLTSKTIMH